MCEDVVVRFVPGHKVREVNVDFAMAGHHYVYPFIPENEIWLEDGLRDSEDIDATIYHEKIERNAMKHFGMDYDTAHKLATTLEKLKRGQGFQMKKTAAQIAHRVLVKCAEIDKEHLRNILAGGLGGAVAPIVGGIAASASKPEGDPTHQFWGTLGGSLLGHVAGGALGHALSGGRQLPTILGGMLAGGLGGYGAQRYMAEGRKEKAQKMMQALREHAGE